MYLFKNAPNSFIIMFIISKHIIFLHHQNTTKIINVRFNGDTRVNAKSAVQTRIIENKLSTAEMNREKEIQKKLEIIRKHVG